MSDLGAVLDVAIGLIFLYLMTSLLVTIVQEGIATALHLRAKNLFDAIENLVGDPALSTHPEYKDLVVDLYKHPLMQSLYRRTAISDKASAAGFVRAASLPSYIPSRTFVVALLDVLRGKTATEATGISQVLAGADEAVAKLPDGRLKRTLTLLVADAESLGVGVNQRASAVSERVESWFNDAMSRASGWYKRKAQKMSFGIGLAITVLINASTFNVAGELWRDHALRAQVSATATAYYKERAEGSDDGGRKANGQAGLVAARWNDQMKRLEASSLPIGWPTDVTSTLPKGTAGWVGLLFGWLVTGLAASLGAAFWFDVLGRALQIRGSGPRVGESAPARKPLAIAAATAEQGETATSATVAVSSGGARLTAGTQGG
jgi:hypothetical protein